MNKQAAVFYREEVVVVVVVRLVVVSPQPQHSVDISASSRNSCVIEIAPCE